MARWNFALQLFAALFAAERTPAAKPPLPSPPIPFNDDTLDWQMAEGYRFAEVKPQGAGQVGFSRVPSSQSGVTFTNHLSELESLSNRILENGSGVAAGDVDGDGWCDLFFCGLRSQSRLYRNLGDWTFQDVTESAGVGCTNLDVTGAAFADLDGDGDLDLVVNSLGGGTHNC